MDCIRQNVFSEFLCLNDFVYICPMKHLVNKIVVPCDPEEINVLDLVNVGYTAEVTGKSLLASFLNLNVIAEQVYTIINHENNLQ